MLLLAEACCIVTLHGDPFGVAMPPAEDIDNRIASLALEVQVGVKWIFIG